MIPSMSIDRYHALEEQFYDYFSQISNCFHDPYGFIDFLNNNTAFFDGPLNVDGPCNYRGGLLEHSLNTVKVLTDLNYFIADKEFTLKQCILLGLFSKLNHSYLDGQFPFIWMDDNYCGHWEYNPEIEEIHLIEDAYIAMHPFINKKYI